MSELISILIVDDEPSIRKTLSAILEYQGYNVSVAEDGREGVTLFKVSRYDIAIMDIVMPEMNGVEATKEIKGLSPRTKIILMTGYGDEHPLVKMAIKEGVDHLFHKPIDLDDLNSTIKSLISASSAN